MGKRRLGRPSFLFTEAQGFNMRTWRISFWIFLLLLIYTHTHTHSVFNLATCINRSPEMDRCRGREDKRWGVSMASSAASAQESKTCMQACVRQMVKDGKVEKRRENMGGRREKREKRLLYYSSNFCTLYNRQRRGQSTAKQSIIQAFVQQSSTFVLYALSSSTYRNPLPNKHKTYSSRHVASSSSLLTSWYSSPSLVK